LYRYTLMIEVHNVSSPVQLRAYCSGQSLLTSKRR
jgi:hypothetical protein